MAKRGRDPLQPEQVQATLARGSLESLGLHLIPVRRLAYEFDLFISYKRSKAASGWVQNHLLPELEMWMSELLPHEARIACDVNLVEGVDWPIQLRNQVHRSRLLLAVWSAPYFRSGWCMAEWQSFRQREVNHKFRTEAKPQGLIYPVRYADGDFFHEDAKTTQCRRDFSSLNYPYDNFKDSVDYLRFSSAVQSMAEDIVEHLKIVPAWDQNFPLVEAPTMPEPNMSRVSL